MATTLPANGIVMTAQKTSQTIEEVTRIIASGRVDLMAFSSNRT
jgi:hypothetical protein